MKKICLLLVMIIIFTACSIAKVSYTDPTTGKVFTYETKDYLLKRQSKYAGSFEGSPFQIDVNRSDPETLMKLIEFNQELLKTAVSAAAKVK